MHEIEQNDERKEKKREKYFGKSYNAVFTSTFPIKRK